MEISQKIVDYAIWYYLKYYPSPRKLTQKLLEKFGEKSENGKKFGGIGNEEIEYILTEKLRNIIQEEEVIQSKIRLFKNKGKSKLYIKQKLFERGENRELIEKYLLEAFMEGEGEQLEMEYNKLKKKISPNVGVGSNDYKIVKQKIIEKLCRKGFKYDDVKRVVG
ncbi:MAG: RecX family transcriptional regulator [Candidatus Gracilibacteria bacterium]|nr:RecX family transcriptional regulator [Candidatus Gracilibacteria bacterium]